MKKDNLIKLAKFILENIKDEQFSMFNYRSDKYGYYVYFKSKNDCGTIGCALGWSPFAPGLEVVEGDFQEKGTLNFSKYSKRVFGAGWGLVWDFLFNSDWCKIGGSREGFVKRVIYLIEGGKDLSITKNHPYRKINPNKIYDY